MGEQEARDGLYREKRRLFKKLTSGLLHLYRLLASHSVKALDNSAPRRSAWATLSAQRRRRATSSPLTSGPAVNRWTRLDRGPMSAA